VVQAVCCALLENHEKCGTPFIFAANGSRLRVYSPEKCATRPSVENFGPGIWAVAQMKVTSTRTTIVPKRRNKSLKNSIFSSLSRIVGARVWSEANVDRF